MNLQDELSQLNAYYDICNYDGKLVCGSLIDGANDILNGSEQTIDAHASTRNELENRISAFYADIEKYL